MDSLIVNIISYLKYLNTDCKLNVSVHFDASVFDRLPQSIVSMLLPYNCHTNTYCVIAKSIDHNKCIQNQRKLLEKCEKGEGFCHTCYAQVYEYIYPIVIENHVVGFVSVSGYRQNNPEKERILNQDIWKNTLNTQMPVKMCEAAIPPLCIMIEQMLMKYLKENRNEYNRIFQFLTEYHTNITLLDVAKHFNRSKSHISHLFKKESGMTIRAYCNDLKLEDAKKLLLNTEIPITEVALDVGFNDTSYFICLFKEKFGISPLQYRRKNFNIKVF